jgi:glycosyltransferase involved in cell wall biosynthesis
MDKSASTAPPVSVAQVVRSDGFAGVERYICQVSNGLTARGHQVTVIGGDPSRVRSELNPSIEFRPAATTLQVARALVAERHVDVVHVHMTAAEGAAWLAKPFLRAPVVATRHFADERGSSRLNRSLAHTVARVITRDIAISEFVARSIDGPTVLLYNGVPDMPQADLEAPVVVMLQRLNAEKQPEVGLRIWAASGLGPAGWRLVIAGRGDRETAIRRLADDLGIATSVDFVGQIADTDQLLGHASVLLATAPEEPFGLSVVEAMAQGVPVVAARGGAHVETVGDDSLLFPPGDIGAGAATLTRLSSDLDFRRQVGARLRRRQQERFALAGHLDRLEAIYEEVTDR